MYSIPDRMMPGFFISPRMQAPANMFPVEESSHPGTKIGKFRSIAASTQLFLGSI